MSAFCWQRHVESRDEDTAATTAAIATLSDTIAKCHGILEAGIGAVARTVEGRRQLHLLAYHTEKIASCLKTALAMSAD